ncbi:MAG: HU family DNA-binding protein [Acidobacteria bacterium]|jgi:DNA-binding protein HU-beta|nr:HU family DNA-binding protein [Acidobacteriota bacterium]
MNRQELIEGLAARTGLPEAAARRAVKALFGSHGEDGLIVDALDRGERVAVAGFGTFVVRARAPRSIRDPRTGAARALEGRRAVAFRPGIALRDRLRGAG